MDPVSICNMALGAIGANRISKLDEDTPESAEAELCVTYFEPVVRKALESAAWMFATGFFDLGAQVALADGEYLPPEMPVKYKLPADTVTVRAWDDGSGDYTLKAKRAGEYMISENTTKLVVEITRFVDDPKLWSPSFCFAVAYKLAEIAAGPLTQNARIEAKMAAMYEAEIEKAEALDGAQGSELRTLSMKTSSLSRLR